MKCKTLCFAAIPLLVLLVVGYAQLRSFHDAPLRVEPDAAAPASVPLEPAPHPATAAKAPPDAAGESAVAVARAPTENTPERVQPPERPVAVEEEEAAAAAEAVEPEPEPKPPPAPSPEPKPTPKPKPVPVERAAPLEVPKAPAGGRRGPSDGPCPDGCALNGECAGHACTCDPGWTGASCGQMRFGPLPQTETGYRPAATEGFGSWGGAPIKGPDGTFHLFVTLFTNTTVRTWYRHSVIAHTTAATPLGPYAFQSVIVRPSGSETEFDGTTAREPTVVRDARSGRFLLFYVGHNCIRDEDECPVHASIGLVSAPDPEGPWERHGEVFAPTGGGWEGHVAANPSAVMEDDGSVWLYYRGDDSDTNGFGVARAAHWKGPYERQFGGAPLFGKRPKPRSADLFVWRDARGYHMLSCGQGIAKRMLGGVAYSTDAVNWKPVATRPAFSHELYYADRGRLAFKNRARPQLLFQDGVPTHLVTAVEELKAYKTFTSVVPIQR